jgi:lycopene cyclase domain-containing protein
MKEYTIIAFLSVLLTIYLDNKSGIKLLKKSEYLIFLLIILCFKIMVNGYLTGSGVVIYDPRYFLGIRMGSIPVEDFMFGFSMVTAGIDFWEYNKKHG